MATSEDDPRHDEGDLAAFFEAERARIARDLPPGFLDATLRDAAAVTASRRSAPPPHTGWRTFLGQLGGWAGATALAGCLAAGFYIGTLEAGAEAATRLLGTDGAAFDAPLADVDAFFDLAASES